MMKVGIPKEIEPEQRVAAVPEIVAKMVKAGMEVQVEAGAGHCSYIADDAYQTAGAKLQPCVKTLYQESDVLLKVNRPLNNELSLLKEKSTLIAPLCPLRHLDLIDALRAKKMTSFSLDYIPRLARTQSMDILSSMSNLAGYKSVLLAATHLGKLFPMMTTAAGTIMPAKILVLGAGVAGLQAIATARRLGGVVLAFDTRPAAGEQVKSLGADFVSLETSHEQSEDAGGYAKEQSHAFYKKEQDIIRPYLKEADVIITTALVPGKRAPLLISAEMVKEMKRGSVIVDLAAEQEGNCELTDPGNITIKHGVTIIGILNLPSTLPVHASQLYSKNVFTFLHHLSPQLTTQLDFSDDLVKSCLITHEGEIVHPAVKEAFAKKGQSS